MTSSTDEDAMASLAEVVSKVNETNQADTEHSEKLKHMTSSTDEHSLKATLSEVASKENERNQPNTEHFENSKHMTSSTDEDAMVSSAEVGLKGNETNHLNTESNEQSENLSSSIDDDVIMVSLTEVVSEGNETKPSNIENNEQSKNLSSSIEDDVIMASLKEEGSKGNVTNQPNTQHFEKLLKNFEQLLNHLLSAQQAAPIGTSQVSLPIFDPDDRDSDIEGWCRVTEVIVTSQCLEGVELLVALTSALKGRAAQCLTKINLSDITWSSIKDILVARFSNPRFIQDYFNDILRFQVSPRESPSESAVRLWNLIERIPKCTMSEEVIAGFVTSLLCQKNKLICRELNSQTVTNKAQLFRILNGISHKRRLNTVSHISVVKRVQNKKKFQGKCFCCRKTGHHFATCRKLSNINVTQLQDEKTCFGCGQSGHLAFACSRKKKDSKDVVHEVFQCEHRPSRAILRTSSGEALSFLFDSGSSCSLIKESYCGKLDSTVRNSLVSLSGIGGDDYQSKSQIQSDVIINGLAVNLLFHVVPDNHISDPIIIGRDILDQGLCVKIDKNNVTFC